MICHRFSLTIYCSSLYRYSHSIPPHIHHTLRHNSHPRTSSSARSQHAHTRTEGSNRSRIHSMLCSNTDTHQGPPHRPPCRGQSSYHCHFGFLSSHSCHSCYICSMVWIPYSLHFVFVTSRPFLKFLGLLGPLRRDLCLNRSLYVLKVLHCVKM